LAASKRRSYGERRDRGRATRDGSLSPPAPRTPGRTKGSPQDLGRRGFPDPVDDRASGRRKSGPGSFAFRAPSGTPASRSHDESSRSVWMSSVRKPILVLPSPQTGPVAAPVRVCFLHGDCAFWKTKIQFWNSSRRRIIVRNSRRPKYHDVSPGKRSKAPLPERSPRAMTLIIAAPLLPNTERQDEEAKPNHGAGRTGTP
jgi:hypothetical protein